MSLGDEEPTLRGEAGRAPPAGGGIEVVVAGTDEVRSAQGGDGLAPARDALTGHQAAQGSLPRDGYEGTPG